MGELFGYEKLEVWQLGMNLVGEVYLLTSCFPTAEQFGLTGQLRRAVVSVPANVAEGYGRGTPPSNASFVRIARGSLYELRTLLDVAVRIHVASPEDIAPIKDHAVLLSRKLDAYLSSLDRQPPTAHR